MTKTEFNKLEVICKQAWRWLAKTGNMSKPPYLKKYNNGCPACQIATKKENDSADCRLCPIDVWRKRARRPGFYFPEAICEDHEYGIWREHDVVKSKAAALAISKMKWTFLKAHEKSKV